MLFIENLQAKYEEIPILKGVNLTVHPGEFHVIYGPNGSGKSTLGKVLLRHSNYHVTKGKILFEKRNLMDLSTSEVARAGIFLSHQTPPAISGVSAEEILRAAQKTNSMEKPQNIIAFRKALRSHLDTMRLSPDFSKRHMNEGASGGERKKMEIVSLFMLGAKLAFLDEIDSGLDFDAMKNICDGIRTFISNGIKSVILVTHSEKVITELHPTKIHIFCDGRIVASGGEEIAAKARSKGFAVFNACKNCVEESWNIPAPSSVSS
ncbi:Fe-S cluster assembly ATPase SufC [Candidatus Peregrinibacteria bacterium]|nr:Fe-S cluster assembly ATPase SufC [Candidatus Peregrinibacteria bacterium]